jgi:hypothetical protein
VRDPEDGHWIGWSEAVYLTAQAYGWTIPDLHATPAAILEQLISLASSRVRVQNVLMGAAAALFRG